MFPLWLMVSTDIQYVMFTDLTWWHETSQQGRTTLEMLKTERLTDKIPVYISGIVHKSPSLIWISDWKWAFCRFQRFVVRPCWTDQFPPWWVFSYQRPELSFPKTNVIFLLTCSSPTTQTNLSYKTFKTWTQMISVSYSADVTPTMLNNWGFLLFFYLFSSIKVNINIIMYFRANHWMKLKTVKCTFCFQLV